MLMQHLCHESFICVTWPSDMTHSYVWHDSFIRVTWLIHTCDMTHAVTDDVCEPVYTHTHTHTHTHTRTHSFTHTHTHTHTNTHAYTHTHTHRRQLITRLEQQPDTLQHTATHDYALQHTATYCSTQHTYKCGQATCNTLLKTTTRCNTLQRIMPHL